jgi:uncharacterized SAM-binding protein YcdF (DUF218 family)
MKVFLLSVLVFMLVLTVGLPLYLGPDDIAGCDAPTGTGACTRVDAIIAISGGDTSSRTNEAVKLYKAGWSDMLIFSGAAADLSGPSNAAAMKKMAIDQGVKADDILIEEYSMNTAENAKNTSKVVEQYGLKKVMLVTSVYHQRRASIEFHKWLGGGVQIVNHPTTNDNQWSNWWWATPYGWILGISEVIKIIFSEASGL